MKTVYLGTSAFAVTILERLAASEHRPSLVVTRPDRPAGRGRKLQSPPVADAARRLGIPLFQPDDLSADDATAQVVAEEADALVVCAYGAIVREPLLSAAPIYNVHPSLLPRWRGAAPIERAIAAGDESTGVSIIRLEAGLDSGPVAIQSSLTVDPLDTYGTLSQRLEELGGTLLLEALDEGLPFQAQPEAGITYAEKLTAADRTLDPDAPAEVNERLVRALTPHIGARVELADGTMLGVREARLWSPPEPTADLTGGAPDGDPAPKLQHVEPLHIDEHGVRLGTLELTVVQPPGGRPMDAASWLRGRSGR